MTSNFLTNFAQVSARHKNFSRGWLLVLGLKEVLVKCATVCVKSVVILGFAHLHLNMNVTIPKNDCTTIRMRESIRFMGIGGSSSLHCS